MKKNITEIVFILDRSGSMNGLEKETIGGFNSMLEKQKKEIGSAFVTTVLFDNDFELLHDHLDINEVGPISDKDYYVRGSTALLDAVGKSINKMVNIQKNLSFKDQAENVVFIITTDGMENSSIEYSYKHIQRMIELEKDKYGWEFIFLGANIDAVSEALKFGINEDRAVNYHSDSRGTHLNYQVLSETVSTLRTKSTISADWKKKIDEDYKNREGNR
jgi:uncharacterized protein YegL